MRPTEAYAYVYEGLPDAEMRDIAYYFDYDYLEDRWFALWTYSDVLPAKSIGTATRLMDVSMRETDGPFAVRYPRDAVPSGYDPTREPHPLPIGKWRAR